MQAFFVFCEVLASYYPGARADTSHLLFTGRYAPGFYFEVIGGLLIPFVLLVVARWRAHRSVVVAASVLALLGILVHRANLIVIGLGKRAHPRWPRAHPSARRRQTVRHSRPPASTSRAATSSSSSSVLMAVATLLFTLALRYVPLKQSEEH